MLEIGVTKNFMKLSKVEAQTHFALWAIAKAPLIIGADLSKISEDNLNIITNKNLIHLN